MEQIKRHLRAHKLTIEWLADRIGLSRHTVKKWDRVPAHHVLQVEGALDGAVTRYQMRPDIYGADPADRKPSNPHATHKNSEAA